MFKKFLLLLFSLFIHLPFLKSAPIPATSSSNFISSSPNFFASELGFTIHAKDTLWTLKTSKNPHVVRVFQAPQKHKGIQPALTVRVDILKRPLSF
ncbi:MAG: hypothetical protein D6797_09190, partial [Bdellovibrio sp.]